VSYRRILLLEKLLSSENLRLMRWLYQPILAVSLLAACAVPLYSEPLALVTSVHGTVTVTNEPAPRPVRLLEWLEDGAIVATGKDSSAVVIFADGQRCEVGPLSQMRVSPQGPRRISGAVATLPASAPMPPLPAMAPGQSDSDRIGALRFQRAYTVDDLFPADPDTVLPDHAVLRFRAVEGATAYNVDVRDDNHRAVFQAHSVSNEIPLPAGTLKAGQHYQWSVSTVSKFRNYGQTEFSTLSEATLANRAAFRQAVNGTDRDSALARVGVDRRLGLLAEARDQLRQLLANSPAQSPDAAELTALLREIDPQ
jgi:hypothetical protein